MSQSGLQWSIVARVLCQMWRPSYRPKCHHMLIIIATECCHVVCRSVCPGASVETRSCLPLNNADWQSRVNGGGKLITVQGEPLLRIGLYTTPGWHNFSLYKIAPQDSSVRTSSLRTNLQNVSKPIHYLEKSSRSQNFTLLSQQQVVLWQKGSWHVPHSLLLAPALAPIYCMWTRSYAPKIKCYAVDL